MDFRITLTPAEARVVQGVLQGLTTQEMVTEYKWTRSTIQNNLHRAYVKLGIPGTHGRAHSRTELIRRAHELHLDAGHVDTDPR